MRRWRSTVTPCDANGSVSSAANQWRVCAHDFALLADHEVHAQVGRIGRRGHAAVARADDQEVRLARFVNAVDGGLVAQPAGVAGRGRGAGAFRGCRAFLARLGSGTRGAPGQPRRCEGACPRPAPQGSCGASNPVDSSAWFPPIRISIVSRRRLRRPSCAPRFAARRRTAPFGLAFGPCAAALLCGARLQRAFAGLPPCLHGTAAHPARHCPREGYFSSKPGFHAHPAGGICGAVSA